MWHTSVEQGFGRGFRFGPSRPCAGTDETVPGFIFFIFANDGANDVYVHVAKHPMANKKGAAKNPRKPGGFQAAAKAKPQRVNPFEIKKSKTKFETVGRRIKGSSKNIIKAREESVQKRKRTLLVEYKQLRKANSFVDHRFGGAREGCFQLIIMIIASSLIIKTIAIAIILYPSS